MRVWQEECGWYVEHAGYGVGCYPSRLSAFGAWVFFRVFKR